MSKEKWWMDTILGWRLTEGDTMNDTWDDMQRERVAFRLLDIHRKVRDGDYDWEDIEDWLDDAGFPE